MIICMRSFSTNVIMKTLIKFVHEKKSHKRDNCKNLLSIVLARGIKNSQPPFESLKISEDYLLRLAAHC